MGGLRTSAELNTRWTHCEVWAFRLWYVYQPALCCMTESNRVDHPWGLLNNRGHDDDPR